MRKRQLSAIVALLTVAACSRQPELVPAPGAMPAPGDGAFAQAAGVRLEIDTDAWRGIPADLGDNFTPVLVTIRNDGSQDLRVRYADFVLKAPSGTMYHALPPFRIDDTVSEPIDVRAYPGFMVAPYLSPFYPRWRVFNDPFLFDEVYFNRYYPTFVNIDLPTGDMIQKALPEGVVQPGGQVSGFLYFEDPDDDEGTVVLTQTLMTPSGSQFGTLEIPLETK